MIVDSFGSPTIRHDLGVFDRQFKLPAPPSLLIIHPAGRIPKFKPTEYQAELGRGDHPRRGVGARPGPGGADRAGRDAGIGERGPQRLPADRRGGEVCDGAPPRRRDQPELRRHRGDFPQGHPAAAARRLPGGGAALARCHRPERLGRRGRHRLPQRPDHLLHPSRSRPGQPAIRWSPPWAAPNLRLDSQGQRTAPDQVWNDPVGTPSASGGGKSVMFGRPAFQNAEAGPSSATHRGVPDISMSAVMRRTRSTSSRASAGTAGRSSAAPARRPRSSPALSPWPTRSRATGSGRSTPICTSWRPPASPGSSTSPAGNNTVSFHQNGKTYTVHGWDAVAGYDLASGLGTVNADVFVHRLAALAGK